jgi:hypothetical protein
MQTPGRQRHQVRVRHETTAREVLPSDRAGVDQTVAHEPVPKDEDHKLVVQASREDDQLKVEDDDHNSVVGPIKPLP